MPAVSLCSLATRTSALSSTHRLMLPMLRQLWQDWVSVEKVLNKKCRCAFALGSHECKMGLGATRDIGRDIVNAIGEARESVIWAIAGCPNSCSQPQLAHVGIVITKTVAEADGQRAPRFDLYRRGEEGLAAAVQRGVTRAELLQFVAAV